MKNPTSLEENQFFSLFSLLIVEDEEEVIAPLLKFFSKRFKTIYTASNGVEGLEIYERVKPDIIITDIQMAKMSGLEMTKEIRKRDGFHTPIVILSAFNDEEYLLESIELGIVRYLKKPIEFSVLENTIYDISAELYQYKKVEELDLKIHDLLDLLKNMIILTDGRVIKYANRAFLNFARYATFEEFQDKYYFISDLDTIIVKIQELIIKDSNSSWFEVMLDSNRENFVTYLHSINDNTPKAFTTFITELPRNRGNYIISFSDITLLEEDMLKLRDEAKKSIKLQILINEEISKHREQEQLLVQQSKMAAMGEMMSAIVHQWRQPLNSVSIISQELDDMIDYQQLDEDSLRRISHNLMMQVEFMNTTIEDFRNFIKPSKEAIEFDVVEAIEDIIKLISPQLEQRFITIDFRHDSECEIVGYKNEFKQVILNLLNNARDAIIEHRVEEYGGKISVRVESYSDAVRIEIEDTGGGIKEEYKDLIFDPYFSSKGDEGTGIGLYMSKTIITQNMRGDLNFKNGMEGAIFAIKLPKKGEK